MTDINKRAVNSIILALSKLLLRTSIAARRKVQIPTTGWTIEEKKRTINLGINNNLSEKHKIRKAKPERKDSRIGSAAK